MKRVAAQEGEAKAAKEAQDVSLYQFNDINSVRKLTQRSSKCLECKLQRQPSKVTRVKVLGVNLQRCRNNTRLRRRCQKQSSEMLYFQSCSNSRNAPS